MELNCKTTLDIPVERVLNAALKKNLKTCFVMGFDEDGECYFAGSSSDGGDIMWLMEVAKSKLLD